MAEIARRAGVGTATIFRRFPTKDDLIAAVFERRLTELLATAREVAGDPDAGRALRRFMEAAVQMQIRDLGFMEAVASRLFAEPRMQELRAEIVEALDGIVARAREAGSLRRDVTVQDIPVLISAVARAGFPLEAEAPGSWRRYLRLVLDGLGPGAPGRLTPKAPSLEQLYRAYENRHPRA